MYVEKRLDGGNGDRFYVVDDGEVLFNDFNQTTCLDFVQLVQTGFSVDDAIGVLWDRACKVT